SRRRHAHHQPVHRAPARSLLFLRRASSIMVNTVQADDAASSLAPADEASQPSAEAPPRPSGPVASGRPQLLCSPEFAGSTAASGCPPTCELRPVSAFELASVLGARRPGHLFVVLVDVHLPGPGGAAEIHPGGATRVISLLPGPGVDLLQSRLGDSLSVVLTPDPDPAALHVAVRTAFRDAAAQDRLLGAEAERRRLAGEITKLNRIGIALSTERDQERLLNFIL